MEIHEKNYIHHDLHSGNIFSYDAWTSLIGDLGLCQQVLDRKDNQNKIFGAIPYLAPEVLSKKPYTKESDIYNFGMIMWEHTTGKKPFHDRPHNHILILDILKGERPQTTDDTPEFYAELMKRCQKIDQQLKKSRTVYGNIITKRKLSNQQKLKDKKLSNQKNI